jgi:putative thioredoxin
MTDHEVSDFQADVLDASTQQPVLVDFWAPWCGPCRQLGPVLERLASEATNWTLVKVNTDEHQAEAQRFGVRGIPSVKLFVDGTVKAEFTGVLPEHAVRKWLDEHLPSETKQRIETAKTALDDGDTEAAEAALQAVLDAEPDHAEAKVLMARALAFRDPERAHEWAASASDIADPTLLQTRESVETLTRLIALADDPAALPDGEGKDAYVAAATALAKQDFHTALERFIEVVQTNRDYDDDGARRACVALFTLLGPRHPATEAHRRTFDMALY